MHIHFLLARARQRLAKHAHQAAVILLGAACCSSYAAGFRGAAVPKTDAQAAIALKIFTPCAKKVKQPMKIGPFALDVMPGCPIAGKGKLPLIIMSHGRGGNFFSHHDTASSLADAGFIVVAIKHVGDAHDDMHLSDSLAAFYQRPLDVKRTIDFVLQNKALAPRIDAQRIGFFGFSRGGYTGLALAGGKPDFLNPPFSCQPAKGKLCQEIAAKSIPKRIVVRDARIKAMIIADPLSFFPNAKSLKNVRIPVQLWGSEKGGDGVLPKTIQAIANNLPNKPDFKVIPKTNHFSFIHPCTPMLAGMVKEICSMDEKGFDRVAMHKKWNADMAAFFKKHLMPR